MLNAHIAKIFTATVKAKNVKTMMCHTLCSLLYNKELRAAVNSNMMKTFYQQLSIEKKTFRAKNITWKHLVLSSDRAPAPTSEK